MELKVWVEGMVRVVCGLSQSTSCQDVVIALAQAIGQTGRYVLVMKIRENERHMLPADCPLQHLAQLGQLAAEVQFILRRTGPSLSEGPHKTIKEERPVLLRPPEPEPVKRLGLQKALSFNLGPSTCPKKAKSSRGWSPSPRASPEPRPSPSNSVNSIPSYPIKEEVFRQILQQQSILQDLEVQIEALEREAELLEKERLSAAISNPPPDLTEQLEELTQRLKQNEIELIYGDDWEEELQAEIKREQDMHRRLQQIQSSIDDQTHEISELQTRSAHQEQDLQHRSQRQNLPAETQQADEALRSLTQELHKRLQMGDQLDAALSETQWRLQTAEERERLERIGMLNKELRQCKLQQFIQQTGGTLQADQTKSLSIYDV
ncbi:ras association domain-containing protein 7-like isoform X2 [Melanotaenia boesemani]|uniref:ras association domain-containing protein 7-like isoform X2 n=1 Tax=Melanotaenia boesemani TaxID=1250792 RepID=UPI001C03DDCD|nr:ras association domain-containing protein 7-like isoform X2 [Melanotaenia boesemani]